MKAGWLAGSLGMTLTGCGGSIADVAFREGAAPGTGMVTFASKDDGDAFVRWGLSEDGLTNRTPAVPTGDGRVTVLGLPTGKQVFLEVVVDRDGKEKVSNLLDVTVPPPSREVIAFSQNVWEPSLACDEGGYVLFSFINAESSGVGIIDRSGKYVFSMDWPEGEQVARVRPGRDGASLVFNVADAKKRDDVARIHRVDLLGNPVSETRTLQGHHDFVEMAPGRFAWLGYDIREIEAPPNNHGIEGTIELAVDTIYEADEGAGEADYDEIWNAWDPEDYPPGPYTLPSGSVNCTPNGCGPSFLKNGAFEFGHGNSLAYVASEDAYYMNWRWLDVTMKVTGSGDLAWQWGGDHSDFALDPDTAFDGPHFSDVWPGGMLMLDNRNRQRGSRLVEYAFDDAGYEQVWEYEEPSGAYENLLGDVRRMGIEGCDNLLVSWSGQAKIQEVTRDGQVVWEVGSPAVGHVTSRVFFVPDLYDVSAVGYPE